MKIRLSLFMELRRRIKHIRSLKYTDPAFWAAVGALIASLMPVIASFFSVAASFIAVTGLFLLEKIMLP